MHSFTVPIQCIYLLHIYWVLTFYQPLWFPWVHRGLSFWWEGVCNQKLSDFLFFFFFIAQASHCGGFSCCGARALGVQASVVVARGLRSCGSRALERRLSSFGARAYLLRSMWHLPGPGLEPMYTALAGGFLPTAPPRKPRSYLIFIKKKMTFVEKGELVKWTLEYWITISPLRLTV